MLKLTENRIIYLDYLRALAIIGIVCCHGSAMYFYGNTKILNNFNVSFFVTFFTCGRFIGIPLFVMISGALLINKHYSIREFFTKRLNRILVPFVFWVIIYMLFAKFILHKPLISNYTLDLIYGESGTIGVIFWFIWMILIVYIGIFLINKIIEYGSKKYKGFDKKFIKILIIISLMIYIMIDFGIIPSIPSDLWANILYIPYALFGYYLYNLKLEDLKFLKKYKINSRHIIISTLLISLIGYTFYVYYVVIESMKLNTFTADTYFQIIVMIFNFAIFLFFKNLSYYGEKYFKKFYNLVYSKSIKEITYSISKCSFGIYFIHYVLVRFIMKVILKGTDYKHHPIFWIPILIITVFLVSWGLTLTLSKIPFIKRFSGFY